MKLISSLAAGGLIAALLTSVGTRDIEGYEHAFFSLARGTAVESVQILGHPVYTLAIGLGVRLPLHGNLGASPAAALAPFLPAPLTYWLLIAAAIGAAMVVVRCALEPLCGRAITWLANGALFCSAPMVSYTVYNDWPETAVTYCALVGCVFAPLALLSLLRVRPAITGRLAALGLIAVVCGLVGTAHPGTWPLVFGSMGLSMAFVLLQPEYTWRCRLAVVGTLTVATSAIVLFHVPDLVREIVLVPGLARATDGPEGSALLANLFPFVPVGNRLPFTFLFLTVAAVSVGATTPDRGWRRLIVGSGLISLLLGMAASALPAGSFVLRPSNTWTLRDPATAFAVLSAALAAAVLRRGKWAERPAALIARRSFRLRSRAMSRVMAGVLLLFAVQGPLYAAALVWAAPRQDDALPWNRDFSVLERRVAQRGMPEERVEPRARIALWPGVRDDMRRMGRASTDFADAGDRLVTAWTKNRTMAGLVLPNPVMFSQTTDLDSHVLCNPAAVRFLRVRYLLMPPETACEGWTVLPDVLVDGRWAVAASSTRDDLVRGVRLADVPHQWRSEPALSGDLALVARLAAFPGTSFRLEADSVILELSEAARAKGLALVLPVAYDVGWHSAAGRVLDIGGLLAVVEADAPRIRLEFRPDLSLRVRAIGVMIAQALGLVGLLALGLVGWQADTKPSI